MLTRLHDKSRKYRKAQAPSRALAGANESDGLRWNEKEIVHMVIVAIAQVRNKSDNERKFMR